MTRWPPSPPDDSLRAALDSVFAGPAYRWVERPDPLRLLREWFGRLTEWLAALREGNPLWYRALVVVLGVGLLAILAHAAWIFWLTVRSGTRAEDAARPAGPPERRDPRTLRNEADRTARDGRYAEALRLGFLALALELDAGGSVTYAPGKTPADYAREARLVPADRGRLGALVRTLYRHVYGAVPCGPDDCARWLADARREWHASAA
ncbi:MAG: DUF4129 domain-containing protein [Gemmatimonadales bacterium]